MFSYIPTKASVLVLTDTLTLYDMNVNRREKLGPGAQSVLANWAFGKDCWGWAWKGVARAALFPFGHAPDAKERAQAKRDLKELLKSRRWAYVLVLQNRSKSAKKYYGKDEDYAEAGHVGTVCWDFFAPPAPIQDMDGTFWQTPYGMAVPLANPQNRDWVFGALTAQTLKRVRDRVPLRAKTADWHTEGAWEMSQGLGRMLDRVQAGTPLAIDIESFSTEDLITVVGLSDGETVCAVPWEDFRPHGQDYTERGWGALGHPGGIMVHAILRAAKKVYVHNGIRFDLPYLARKGLPVHGKVLDTFLLHGLAYNQLRHGLQPVAAQFMPVSPWKTHHTASVKVSGLDKDDPRAWIQDPKELRAYCAWDTHNTWGLGEALRRETGVEFMTQEVL